MQDIERARVAAWITHMKGDRTGKAFAEDVTATTGWKVDRSRLSKYGNASIHIGRDVIAHLSDYAEAKGLPALDLRPTEPELPPLELALRTLVHELTTARDEQDDLRRQLADLKKTVGRLVATDLARSGTAARRVPPAPPPTGG